jgi:hypothetical protein
MASHLAAARCHVRDSNAESARTLYSAAQSRTNPTKFVAFQQRQKHHDTVRRVRLGTRLRNDNPSTTPITERRIKGRMSERQTGYSVLALGGRPKGNNLTSLY